MYSSNPSDRLIHVRHVARRLAVSERTIRNLARTGHLPAIRVGVKLWRFRERDIAAYLARQSPGGGQ